ncbi:NAD(P)/FAD-dependent oxidoreductase [Noviherbaspirillum sp. CPCC 100848]|uniref:NAD(P)/FAD-dependent oxidoreductase n=1 Tax=Noviherbaspirillum album TaxID=3080276 RepID=A0ABU6J5I7_9BURK|nr:NAD(P)/FAD-dependent oxidoreductase [Noviherbaspirillum sp. CPCC 100848]MEC4718615.1 NAD(P)/FAD-dependent oxidoreductase [Noviherbaspirillum sp. CPCC 100848]
MQTIVIAGGGAGGLELATRLGDCLGRQGRARIVLVDRSPTHFWKPLLHTVASGKRDPQVHEVQYAAQASEHGFEFVCGEVLDVDRRRKTVSLGAYRDAGGNEILPPRTVAYDRLVLAFGAVTNFFNIPGAAEHSMTLDSVWEAEHFRKRFLSGCMQAGSRHAALNIIIVGGGATGVELAAELVHAVRELARYNVHALDPERDVHISILERGELLLPHLNPRLSRRAARHLVSLGIAVRTSTTVARVEHDAVVDAEGTRHPSDMTLWAAGVEGPEVCATMGLALNRLGQVIVTPSLQTLEDRDIFAIGDCSSYVCPSKGAAVPPRAQAAHQQAMYLAEILSAKPESELPPFRYRDYGSLVSLGPFAAVGSLLCSNPEREMLLGGVAARVLYGLMYQKHVMALHGFLRMAAQSLAHWLRGKVTPSVKLH